MINHYAADGCSSL